MQTIAELLIPCSDEAAAHVAWLYDNLGLKRISVFFQDDGFGRAGFEGVRRALRFRGSDVHSWGSHPRNTLFIIDGLNNITSTEQPPEAVVLFVIYDPAATFLQLAASQSKLQSCVYIAPSVVNTDELIHALNARNLRPRLYITQVFPNPTDTSFEVVREYREALAASSLAGTAEPSFLGLEGYMAGRLATRALQLVSGPITAESLTNTVYEHPLFFLGGLRYGPYQINTTTSSLRDPNRNVNTSECLCNQGGHEVYLTRLVTEPRLSVETVEEFDFSFDTCGLQFPVYNVDAIHAPTKMFMQALAGISASICALFLVGVWFFRHTKTMKSSSPLFLSIILFGAILLSLSPLLAAEYHTSALPTVRDVRRHDEYLFIIWCWFIGLGFQFMFATIAVKTFRVDKIFNSLQFIEKIIVINEKDLLVYLSIPVLLEVMLLVLWTAVSYPTCVRVPSPANEFVLVDLCYGPRDLPFLIIQGILFIVVAAFGCFYAWRTRAIRYGSFNESREILFVVYNLVVICVVLIPLNVGFIYNPLVSALIRSLGVIFLVIVSIATLFGAKFFRILIKAEGLSSGPDSNQQNNWRSGTNLSLGPVASMFPSNFSDSSTVDGTSTRAGDTGSNRSIPRTSARSSDQQTEKSDTDESSWEPPPQTRRKFWEDGQNEMQSTSDESSASRSRGRGKEKKSVAEADSENSDSSSE